MIFPPEKKSVIICKRIIFFEKRCIQKRIAKELCREWDCEERKRRQSLKMSLIVFDRYNLIMGSWRIIHSFSSGKSSTFFIIYLTYYSDTCSKKKRIKKKTLVHLKNCSPLYFGVRKRLSNHKNDDLMFLFFFCSV